MTGTVDVVIAGSDAAALAATIDAARHGLRVLVVIRSSRVAPIVPFRRSLRSAGLLPPQVRVMIDAEIACVDGINGVEAVVVRHRRTGRLSSFNTRAVMRFS